MSANAMIFKFSPPTDYALSNLRNRVLFCRHYSEFNDPFEFRCIVKSGIPDKNLEESRYREALRTWGFPEVPDEEIVEQEAEYFDSLTDCEPRFQEMFDRTRLVCFGSESTNLLMWAHYADGLRGFCIVFDEVELLKGNPEPYLTDVQYSETPPTADSFVYAVAEDQHGYHMQAIHDHPDDGLVGDYGTAADDAMALMKTIWQRVFATKPLDWEYEHEKRLLLHAMDTGKEPMFYTYPVAAVTEVVVGERMPLIYREHLERVLLETYGPVPIKTATRSEGTYDITIS
jgi:hypothetical protein